MNEDSFYEELEYTNLMDLENMEFDIEGYYEDYHFDKDLTDLIKEGR